VTGPTPVEDLLRELAPQVLGVLVRRHGGFDTCEDAVQEALLAAATQWPAEGRPANPKGWLITVASRRRTELCAAPRTMSAARQSAAMNRGVSESWSFTLPSTTSAGCG
jgi:predicted RNA polymerase sigma factor